MHNQSKSYLFLQLSKPLNLQENIISKDERSKIIFEANNINWDINLTKHLTQISGMLRDGFKIIYGAIRGKMFEIVVLKMKAIQQRFHCNSL